jgi:predicted amino acid racemase
MYKKNLEHNYRFLNDMFARNKVNWGIVSKLLCGNKMYLEYLIQLGVKEVHDSRISNLRVIKELNPKVRTVYIKPPAKENISKIIEFADVSMNTEYFTLKLLSAEAKRQDKVHEVIIMIETGDLREGVMGDHLVDFYEKIFRLPNIRIIGLGTNLNCLYGVMPSQDKLIQLCLYKQIIELKFGRTIPLISGGTSVTIALVLNKQLPKGVNHFRVGETLFFGVNLFNESLIEGMKSDVFELYTQIIEITKKPMVPSGELAANPQGNKFEFDEQMYGQETYRAILDLGLLDIDPKYLLLEEHDFNIAGASSDMLVLDLGKNEKGYKVGDVISFKMKYMGALAVLNSDYIEKIIE